LPGTNTLAYLVSSSAMKEKRFITLTSGVNVMKLFMVESYDFNELERLSLAGFSS
jgi:hypothetical protein